MKGAIGRAVGGVGAVAWHIVILFGLDYCSDRQKLLGEMWLLRPFISAEVPRPDEALQLKAGVKARPRTRL